MVNCLLCNKNIIVKTYKMIINSVILWIYKPYIYALFNFLKNRVFLFTIQENKIHNIHIASKEQIYSIQYS